MEALARLITRAGTREPKSSRVNKVDKYITKLPAVLGRASELQEGVKDGEQICLCISEPTLSRHHAVIEWNEVMGAFNLRCTSKNGVIVDNTVYTIGQIAPLTLKSSVRMGSVKFYFISHTPCNSKKPVIKAFELEKVLPSNKLSYFDLVAAAFRSKALSQTSLKEGIMQRDIVNWIAENFEGFSDSTKRQNLNQGVYMTLTKFYDKAPYQIDDKLKKNRWQARPLEEVGEKRKMSIGEELSPSKRIGLPDFI